MRLRRASALAVVLLLASAEVALAQDGGVDPQARAQAELLFREGTELLEAGSTQEACAKLQGAVDLTKGEALGGKLVLARCYEQLGKTATAWGLYREVAGRAAAAGQTQRAADAEAGAEALAPKLHFIELAIAEPNLKLATLGLSVDGRTKPRAAWAARMPVDPGQVEVTLSAQGKVAQTRVLTIPSAPGSSRVVFDVALVDGPRAPVQAPPVRETEGEFWSSLRIAGLSVAMVGAAGVAAGAAVGLVAKSDYDDALSQGGCTGSPPVCDDAAPVHDARTMGDVATGVFFGGVGLSALGLVLFAVAPSTATTAGDAPVAVDVGPLGFRVRGAF